MWVTDLIIEKEREMMRRLKKPEILPKEEPKSKLTHLDIKGFLERRKMRKIKERK